MIILPKIGFSGAFRCHAVKAKSGRVRMLADWFPNLITTSGLDYVASNTQRLTRCGVGSGSTPPEMGDIALEAQIAWTSANGTNSSNTALQEPPYAVVNERIHTFQEGAAAGNLSEIAIGPPGAATGADPIFCRSLIRNQAGEPATIQVLSDEILVVTYRHFTYPPLVDRVQTIVDGSDEYEVTTRASGAGNQFRWGVSTSVNVYNIITSGLNVTFANRRSSAGPIAAITDSPSGTATNNQFNNITFETYVPGSFERIMQAVLPITQGNHVGGIQSVVFNSGSNAMASFQHGFNPPVMKTEDDQFTFRFKWSWGNYEAPEE